MRKQLFKMLVLFSLLFWSESAISQNSGTSQADFWSVFELCTSANEYQTHYPALSNGQVMQHTIMDNGLPIPAPVNSAGSSVNFNIANKAALLGSGATEFFIIHNFDLQAASAQIEIVYYYNFDGTYEDYVRGTFSLSKLNGLWSITSSQFE